MSEVVHGGDIMLFSDEGDSDSPDWQPFAHATSHTITHSMNTNEISSKDTGRWTKTKPGKHGVSTIEVQGLHTWDGFGYFDLKEKKDNQEKVMFKLSGRETDDEDYIERTEEEGDKYEEGSGYITNLSREAPHDGNATYSATISIDGKTDTKEVEAAS